MKKLLILTTLVTINLLTNTASTFAGSEGGGGGDASEARVNEIRSDILGWINKGGALGLKLTIPQTHYEEEMKKILLNKEVAISFTENKVEVENKEKTCRGYFENHKPQLLCNIARFEKTLPSDQYRLIHHEYAGLALIERNEGSSSDYEISNQITDFLKEEKVLRLALHPNKNLKISDLFGAYTFVKGTKECPKKLGINLNTEDLLEINLSRPELNYTYTTWISSYIFDAEENKIYKKVSIEIYRVLKYPNDYFANKLKTRASYKKINPNTFQFQDIDTFYESSLIDWPIKTIKREMSFNIENNQLKLNFIQKSQNIYDNIKAKCHYERLK